MARSTLTIPAQTWPVGTTTGQRALPGNQTYSHADITVDFSPWTTPTSTTLVDIGFDFSYDGGTTWWPLGSFTQTDPPPYATKTGTTSTVTISWSTIAALNPSHLRGHVTVAGAAVALGTITVAAS